MKLHIVTVGEPKLAYAKTGWDEYLKRLQHYHQVRVTHVPDKWAYDAAHLLQATGSAYKVALAIEGTELSSPGLAAFLDKRALESRKVPARPGHGRLSREPVPCQHHPGRPPVP